MNIVLKRRQLNDVRPNVLSFDYNHVFSHKSDINKQKIIDIYTKQKSKMSQNHY